MTKPGGDWFIAASDLAQHVPDISFLPITYDPLIGIFAEVIPPQSPPKS